MDISRQFTHQYLTTVFNVKHRGIFLQTLSKKKNQRFLPKTRSSLMFLMQNQSPAGKVQTRMWRSKKKDTHVVGWCSDTEAMIGMWIFAYLERWRKGRGKERKRERERQDLTYGSQRVCGDKSHRRSCWLTPKWCAAEQIIYLLGMHTHDKRQTNLARLMSNVLCCVWVSDLHPTYLFIISFNPAVCMQFGRKRILVEQLGNKTHGTLIN